MDVFMSHAVFLVITTELALLTQTTIRKSQDRANGIWQHKVLMIYT